MRKKESEYTRNMRLKLDVNDFPTIKVT